MLWLFFQHIFQYFFFILIILNFNNLTFFEVIDSFFQIIYRLLILYKGVSDTFGWVRLNVRINRFLSNQLILICLFFYTFLLISNVKIPLNHVNFIYFVIFISLNLLQIMLISDLTLINFVKNSNLLWLQMLICIIFKKWMLLKLKFTNFLHSKINHSV